MARDVRGNGEPGGRPEVCPDGLLARQCGRAGRVHPDHADLPAASALGIPVARVKIATFMICSVLAGFAGMIQALRLNSYLPSLGEGMELQAVAAAVIGGTSLSGGIGSIVGGLIGATLIRVIDNGMVMSQVNASWFKFAIGALTILAVIGNSWMRKRGRAMKVETDK
jgi:simple sugar transport system permease protein